MVLGHFAVDRSTPGALHGACRTTHLRAYHLNAPRPALPGRHGPLAGEAHPPSTTTARQPSPATPPAGVRDTWRSASTSQSARVCRARRSASAAPTSSEPRRAGVRGDQRQPQRASGGVCTVPRFVRGHLRRLAHRSERWKHQPWHRAPQLMTEASRRSALAPWTCPPVDGGDGAAPYVDGPSPSAARSEAARAAESNAALVAAEGTLVPVASRDVPAPS